MGWGVYQFEFSFISPQRTRERRVNAESITCEYPLRKLTVLRRSAVSKF
jgi:hypothetical protein